MSNSREVIILSALLKDGDYASKVVPFLKADYFQDNTERMVFETIIEYNNKYTVMPNKTALLYESTHKNNITPEAESDISFLIDTLFETSLDFQTSEWMLETTERFCQEKEAYNVISTAISIYNGEETKIPESAIPDMLREAVNITFDQTIGHDWLDDAEKRYDFYTDPVACIPFDIDVLNEISGGHGIPRKTLNVILAGVNCGKTGFMCHLAASYAKQGFNVVYFTLEMREELISKRIDANLLGVNMDDLVNMGREAYLGRINAIKQKTYGKIIVKEFPNGAAHAGHFNHVIKELKNKKGIKPDIIIVDYIGICASSRIGLSGVNSYTYLKHVSEELRALAVEHDAIMWSAVQLNRTGFDSTDVGMSDVADSFGIPATADFMVSLMRTEELDECSQVAMKQIKSRYGNKSDKLRFVLGCNQQTQTYYDVEQSMTPTQQNQESKVESMYASKPSTRTRLTGLS